jgi:hypothetical protein
VTVCNVTSVREVEQVVIVPNLELGLALAIGRYYLGQDLDIAFTNNACWSDGARQEILRIAICLENCSLGIGLGFLVIWP